jgi:hypothetical protein
MNVSSYSEFIRGLIENYVLTQSQVEMLLLLASKYESSGNEFVAEIMDEEWERLALSIVKLSF